jgi:HD-like signal output (HDOD) protein
MNSLNRRILFVGSEAHSNTNLREELAVMDAAWQGTFSNGGQDGLSLLEQNAFDAVVVDETLHDMESSRFLDAVQQRYPATRRLIVSELDGKSALKWTGTAHQCIPKPWEAETLRSTLERSFTLGLWLSNPRVRDLVRRMTVVPSPPDLYFAVVRALQSPEVDLEELYDRAAKDPAMTAKLLQVANSAALGLRHKISNVAEAISYLGLETTRSLILLAHTFSYCDRSRAAGFNVDRLWKHSFNTGALARRIARTERASREVVDECFLAGLLHDLGELLLAVNLPDEYNAVLARKPAERDDKSNGSSQELTAFSFCQAEQEILGATHAEIGAELMATWNLPLSVVEALALHHRPASLVSSRFGPLAAVHAADAIEHELSRTDDSWKGSMLDLTYLEDLDLKDHVEEWRDACQQELTSQTNT